MPSEIQELKNRLERIREDEDRLEEEDQKLRQKLKNVRDRDPKNAVQQEAIADKKDALRSERKRIRRRLIDLGELKEEVQDKIDRERKEQSEKASENFWYSEFDCNDGTPCPKEAYPAVREWCEKIGEPARKQFGPIFINSAFRHDRYNASIGGEDNSVHIYNYPGRNCKAVAVDWRAARGGPKDWYDFAAGRADGRGYYPNSGFTHSDTRNNIGWPDATWSG